MDWTALLPGLVATFAGVFLAFLIDRLVFGLTNLNKRSREKKILKVALISIKKSLEFNKDNFISLRNTFDAKTIKVILPLDFLIWSAYKNDIYLLLKNISLRNDLIRFYMKSEHLFYLSNTYFVLVPKVLESSDGVNRRELEDYIGTMRVNVKDYTNECLGMVDELIKAINTELTKF
jgi:hypothetical protein